MSRNSKNRQGRRGMLGARLARARRRAKLSQIDLAVAMGNRYDQTMISHVETGRSGLVADGIASAACALDTSADYLLGLTDDPASTRDRAAGSPTVDIVALNKEAALAGDGSASTVVAERSSYSFSRARLEESGIDPTRVSVFRVRGESMAPTLADGSLILVDYLRDVPRQNCLYVFRSDDALFVKRARWRQASWWWYSDDPRWAPFPLEGSMRVWGEVRWYFRLFDDGGS